MVFRRRTRAQITVWRLKTVNTRRVLSEEVYCTSFDGAKSPKGSTTGYGHKRQKERGNPAGFQGTRGPASSQRFPWSPSQTNFTLIIVEK